jgi:hypothetical protein
MRIRLDTTMITARAAISRNIGMCRLDTIQIPKRTRSNSNATEAQFVSILYAAGADTTWLP